jgi:Na+/proline symporter
MKLIGVVLYLLILLIIGAVASRRMKDLRDYYAGGKRFGFWAAAFSSRATGESAWLLIGLTGMGAAVGVQAFWIVLGEVLGVAAAWTLLCGRFKRLTDRYDSITIPDYLESRLRDTGHRIRLVAAFTLVVFVTIYVSAQIDAIGTAFEGFLGWNYYLGAVVGFAVVLVYIVSGGFVAVVWSDVFQGTLMVLGLVALPLLGLVTLGGIAPALSALRAQDPLLLSPWGPDGRSLTSLLTILSFLAIGKSVIPACLTSSCLAAVVPSRSCWRRLPW